MHHALAGIEMAFRMSAVYHDQIAVQSSKFSLGFRLYTWSIIADPLLFFVILDQNDTGVNLTLARVLQAAFVTTLFLGRLLPNAKWTMPNPKFPLFRNFSIYVFLLVIASIFGVLFYGTYKLDAPYTLEHSSFVVEAIRGPYTRPFFEFLILLYYFFYYVVMPKYMFRSRMEFDYLFKWVILTFYFMLFIGLPEVMFNYLEWGYIPKHSTHTEFGYVGERFHAFLGEPRDAFPYLLFGLAVVYIRSTIVPNTRLPRALLPSVFLALVMTQSASGIIGLGLSAFGVLIYFSLKSFRRFVWAAVVVGGLVPLTIFLVSLSPRMNDYIQAFSDVWAILNSGEQLPYLAAVQSSNFLPFWNMWLNLKALNWLPVFFGSGLGTTSIVNNNLTALFIEDSSSELMNANAQITRIVFESGLIGFLVYLNVFINPVKKFLEKFSRNKRANFILFVLLLGASLGHRSATIFIYLGIVIALLTNWPGKNGQSETVATFRC